MDSKAIISLIVFTLSYFFIAIERVPRVYITVFGATLLVLFKVFTPNEVALYIDWDTIGFLFGTFMIVKIIEDSGFFNYLALFIARKLDYNPVKILIVFPALSWLLSGFISSITLLVFFAPLTYALSKILKFDPVPFIIAEACLANIGGAGTLMGDPPNIILGSMFKLGFVDFILHNFLLSLIAGIGAIFTFYLMNRKNLIEMKNKINKKELLELSPHEAIEDKFMMRIGLFGLSATVVLLLLRDFIEESLPINISLCSLIPSFAILSIRGNYPKLKNILREIDIETLIFFAGLFVIVGSLEKTELIQKLANMLGQFAKNGFMMATVLFWGGAFSSALIDNVPEAISFGYLVKHLMPELKYSFTILIWASSLGLDIGGNFTPIGASANVVGYSFLENRGLKIGWSRWIKLSFIPTMVALSLCWLGLYGKYLIGFY
ncbi:hypothetical protein J7L87_03250 [bacterium]|nr:hypothetical protein [bacterium]